MLPRKSYVVPLPGGRSLSLGGRTLVMGVVNVTPDSFADGGLRFDPERAVADAIEMEAQGADILDIGGESTRPGADPLPAEIELARVLPVLAGLADRVRVPISIDTYKAEVARAAIGAGASIVNDISALRYDPALADVIAPTQIALILMHNRGRSRDMYREAIYGDVMKEIAQELGTAASGATARGVGRDRLILDPGLGFAKRAEHTYTTLARLDALAALDRPLLVGPSRKSFLQAALGQVRPEQRDWGSAAAVTAAILGGAHIVRVHAVAEMVHVARVADMIRQAAETP